MAGKDRAVGGAAAVRPQGLSHGPGWPGLENPRGLSPPTTTVGASMRRRARWASRPCTWPRPASQTGRNDDLYVPIYLGNARTGSSPASQLVPAPWAIMIAVGSISI